jgi:hypothetical protein
MHATHAPAANFQASVSFSSSSLIMVSCWPTVAFFWALARLIASFCDEYKRACSLFERMCTSATLSQALM